MEAEMLCLLLERLELSKGFNNLEKKTNRPHTSKITLLPSRQVVASLTAAKSRVGASADKAIASLVQQRPQPFVSLSDKPEKRRIASANR